MNVGVFACIARGNQTSLILVKKRSKKESTSVCDRFGFNAFQFASEIHQPYIIPFICGLYANPNHIFLAVAKAKWHQGPDNKKLCEDCCYV